MSERADVVIVGSGFGGSISAFRLAEAYETAGADPKSIVVLERGRRHRAIDFKQSLDLDNLGDLYHLTAGQGAQVVTASSVGGGSVLYGAASLRAPTQTFERRDHRPDDGPDRRMWPAEISRAVLSPFYTRAERALRVRRPTWSQVSKAGGLWAANLRAAGHTCDRLPLAINPDRCVDAAWCQTGCIFGAMNSLFTNYLGSAEALGVQVRPDSQTQAIAQSSARPYRYKVTVAPMDNGPSGSRNARSAEQYEIECKVLILAAGAMGTTPLLMRSRPALPSLSNQLGRHVGANGDHLAAIQYDPGRVRQVLGLEYADFYKGRPLTTVTYDFFAGNRRDGTRFTIEEALTLFGFTAFLYDDGQSPAGEPSWWGRQKKDALGRWNERIELLAMVEDTNDGEFLATPPEGSDTRPGRAPIMLAPFVFRPSAQSQRVRAAADAAIERIASHAGLGRLMRITETRNVLTAHPIGGCRMADDPSLGVVDASGAVHGYEGLYCLDSSIIPTSLGVNPSLTVAALVERAAERLVARGPDLGLPEASGIRPGIPVERVGPRVVSPIERSRRQRMHRSRRRRTRQRRSRRN